MDEIKERLSEYETSETVKMKRQVEKDVSVEQASSRDRAHLEILDHSNPSSVKLREIIRGGIGNVNIGDITMAKAANGTPSSTVSQPLLTPTESHSSGARL
jgi:hypothetical protein